MKKNRLGLIIAVLVLIAGAVYAASQDTTVYITRTGEKYHTERCASVRNSKIAVSLGDAVSKGYEPCKRCKPPVLN
jgi:methylphosphotriester-DNA--protein-cysteine methyltransferase